MRSLDAFRSGKPGFYPDQAVYAEFACAEFKLSFEDIGGGTGLAFCIASQNKRIYFGAGRCSYYPQNSATASTLASDKHFTNQILADAGVATLGGDYFFLHGRHRANRPGGHERKDALAFLQSLGGIGFVKPLAGSRGDFAQIVQSEAALAAYLDQVAQHYDAIVLQPVYSGLEWRIFLLDQEVLYCARKYPPFVLGDGTCSIRDLLVRHNKALMSRGLSPVAVEGDGEASLDMVLAKGERRAIPGRTNLSAGGTMVLEAPRSALPCEMAKQAARAVGLRVAAIDLFTDIDGDSNGARVIEVNANPSIRLLEESSRSDLILKIWHHTFCSTGLLSV
jgi:hypothetical protein